MRLLLSTIIVASGTLGAMQAHTAQPAAAPRVKATSSLKPEQLQQLQQALVTLTEARRQIGGMVSECNGGEIMVLACPAPQRAPSKRSAGCIESVASCNLVAALKETDAAIDRVNKALSE